MENTRTEWQDRLRIVGLMVAIKGVLLVFGGQVFQILTNTYRGGAYESLMLWNRWDVLHYQRLAEFGYGTTPTLKPSMVFYPLLPGLIRFVSFITGEYIVSSFIIASIVSIVAALYFYDLVKFEYSRELALRSVWFFLIFPTAYFLHVPYTEGLFLMLVFASIYEARKERWLTASIIAAFACATRGNGIVLVLALGVEVLHQFWKTRKWQNQWLYLAIAPIGFLLYLGIVRMATGDAFSFVEIRQQAFFISSAAPWTGIKAVFGQLDSTPMQAQMVGIQELLFVALGLICAVISWFKLRPIYSVWITFNWLLVTSVTFVASVPRYTLSMFPIFILAAMLAKEVYWLCVLTFISLIYFGIFSGFFARGFWAF